MKRGHSWDTDMSQGPTQRGRYAGRGRYKRRYSAVPRYRKWGSDRPGRVPPVATRESKAFDTDVFFSIDATGEVPATGQLVLIPQGALAQNRVGRKVTVTSVWLKGTLLYVPVADTEGAGTAVIKIMLDKQANGTATNAAGPWTNTDFVKAFPNLDTRQRFRTLKSIPFTIRAGSGIQGAFGRDCHLVDEYVKCNIPIMYNGANGVIGEIESNNIFLMCSTGDTTVDDKIFFEGKCRIRYFDN